MLAVPVVVAPQAAADQRAVTVNTGAGELNVRSAPSANSRKIGSVANQARVVIVCYTRGTAFSGGPYRLTTNIWNQLDKGGYVTDAMLNTGSNDPVVPRCDGEAPAPVVPARATGRTSQDNPAPSGSPLWGAMEKWFQVSKRQFYPAISGAPKDLAQAARAAGWSVVERPEPRSIVVFAPRVGGAPPAGHVAWVDTIADRRDGQYIGITEVHGNGDGLNTWTSRQARHLPGMSYILLP
jgi:surface antigen